MTDEALDPTRPVLDAPAPRAASRQAIVVRLVTLVVAAIVLYGLLPDLASTYEQLPNLATVRHPAWFLVMIALEIASFACSWALLRIALPRVSWFIAATAQLTGNAVSRVVPGGAAVGGAMQYRMLSTSGVEKGQAGAALTANSIISTGVLAALPAVALLWSIVGARVPDSLALVAWAGAVLFLALFGIGFVLVRYDAPLRHLGDVLERVVGWVLARLHRSGGPTTTSLIASRDQLVATLGPRWRRALAAATGNWMFDYFALVTALVAVNARPKPSLVLLAYAAAAVLAMIPITPGGLGFVEAGLTSMLVAAGIPGQRAILATLAYRLASYWLPILAGALAYHVYRVRYGRPPDGPNQDDPRLHTAEDTVHDR